tara:strand:- start:232 stop:1188 length:957 start_codon:yes stop_codon:yes gene_type:complete
MTSIKKLIFDINKKSNFDILDSININYITYNDAKLLINNFYEECINSKFGNANKILNYIKKSDKIIKISSNKTNICFYLYCKKNTNSIFKLIKIFRRVLILSQIYNINKNINFHLALCNFKRYMPNKNNIFDCINFNGGFTNILGNDIYIYRSCEYSKVILHEFLHHVNIINDSTMTIHNNDMNKIKTFFNISINTILLPNESIIEFWATVYNLIFISYEYNINFDLLYKKELDFSYNQFLKILNHKKNNQWYEKTNIFCYFILKFILLKNYKKFLKVKLPYNSKEFIDFLINNSKNIKLTNNYNKNKNLNAMIFSSF